MAQNTPEIERAKALIRKIDGRTTANGFTEAEALEAAVKIGQLLEQFDLELSEVFVREEVCRKVEVYASDRDAQGFVTGIGRLCSLKTYHVGGSSPVTFVLFGLERDVELALYLYEIINEAVNNEWAKSVKAGNGFKAASKVAFRSGFATRMHNRLVEMAEHREAEHRARQATSSSKDLVLVREAIVEEEWEKTGVKLSFKKRPPIRDVAAYYRGHDAANNVNLHDPLSADKREALG